jgi:integrase/recombinase XerD
MSNLLNDFIKYLESTNISNSTLQAYKSDLTILEELLGCELVNASGEMILNALGLSESKSTINRKITTVNKFFNFCKSEYRLDSDIAIKKIKLPKNLPQFLTYDEIKDGVAKIETKDWKKLRDKVLILFLYATGAKVSEALDVKIIDIQDFLVKLIDTKGKERLVPVPTKLLKMLNSYLNQRDIESQYLWINAKGDRLSRISAFNITKKYLNVSPHVLRHSFATTMVLNGADIKFVSELLGYTSINSAQSYTKFSKDDIASSLKKYHPLSK